MRSAALIVCLVLAACATPREACLSAATLEVRTLDRLIAEVQGNLDRGYAIQRDIVTETDLDLCVAQSAGKNAKLTVRYCNTTTTRTVSRPEAIDPAAERRKLAQLRQSRARAVRQAQAAQLACAEQYPDS